MRAIGSIWGGLAMLAALAAGCATLPRADVASRDDGWLTVTIREEQSVRALAVTVYDDLNLADGLAEAAGIPADDPVAAGTVLVLPDKRTLKDRLATSNRARKLRDEGEAAQRRGDWTKAEKEYREAWELRPDLPDVRRFLGVALLRNGKLEESLALLREASFLTPNDADTRWAYGAALRENGQREEALAELDAAVRLDENNARAHYDLARTLDELGRRGRARDAYREFVFAFPGDPWVADAQRRLDELSKQ